jgi:lipoprotein-releasing system permease protein
VFQPLPLSIGLRYVRSRSHAFFVSFITWISLAGVGVGVAALIVILSVMNGFEGELRDRLLSLSAAIRVTVPAGAPPLRSDELVPRLSAMPGVTAVVAYAEAQVLAVHQPEMLPLVLRGIDVTAGRDSALAGVAHLVSDGSAEPLRSDPDAVLLGRIVADRLDVRVGDRLTLLVPVLREGGLPDGRLREFTVRGIFEAGIQDHDSTLAFVGLPVLQSLGTGASGESGLRLEVAIVEQI